ncbi:hypothetical protein SH449x_000655 [Pirellulaceae bacterium SH449]
MERPALWNPNRDTSTSFTSPTIDLLKVVGLSRVASASYQEPDQESDRSSSQVRSPYDDVFGEPLPPIKQPRSPIASPSDRILLEDRIPQAGGAEIDEFTSQQQSRLDPDRNRVVPYQSPNVRSPSENVVPLPVIPAPADFPGFFPPDPNANTLPEPRRTFELPKPEVVNPMVGPSQTPNYSEFGNGTGSMPWHHPEMFQDGGMENQIWRAGRANVEPSRSSFYTASYGHRFTEDRSVANPLSTLPERLQSRRYLFKINPYMPSSSSPLPLMSDTACQVEFQHSDFAPNPQTPQPLDSRREIETYSGKYFVETQRPWIEWGRPFYTGGMYEPGIPVFSETNLLTPSLLVYGDYRTAVGIHRFGGNPTRQWAHRLNLDIDMRFTGTERFHMFVGPFDDEGSFTKLDFSDSRNVRFDTEIDFQPVTAFFEGDLGAIAGSLSGTDAPFDLPFTMGLVPLLYQNGIWMEDAIAGFAIGSPWRHSRPLNWANFDMTFFAGFADINSPAFRDENSAKVYGTAWFIEAYEGYIEADYAYLDDREGAGKSYHNAAIAYTRRYFGRISNSIRLIGNAGQRGPLVDRTADGVLLLLENSLITSQPSHFVPYFNAFLGNGRPQSVARAGGSGGILRNTGINFESDGLTAYPTLNDTGANSYGGAVGFNLLSADFRQQFVAEFTALNPYGNPAISRISGAQYAIGARYQRAINNRALIRFDAINGWLDNDSNIYGMRSEFRWKF